MPDAPTYRSYGESRDYLRWQTPVGRIKRFTPHPANYNK
ncbi:prepilin peptidase A domain protein [Escherichia sp. E4742]|nr:prepilin peptidase A domain protein [Escherichia sp. E4742]TGB53873.1 prepilin peptidase A domain protein [Escherichia sp. E4742]TLJ06009.1 prepilin peptidase A domain protein [Escherichia sp. E4742]